MTAISLPAFLKILTKGTPQKVTEYGKYLTPGGYNFYWSLKEAVHAMMVGGESYADCFKTIDDIPREPERACNLEALKNLQKWKNKIVPEAYFTAPVGLVTTPAGHLSVKLEPEFGLTMSGQRHLLQVWYSKHTTLTKVAISIGNRLIEKHLCVNDFKDCKPGILDLRRKEIVAPTADDLALDLMIAAEFAWIDSFFQSHKDQAKFAVA